jgi:hypothetical protein
MSRANGFVEMATKEEARRAIDQFNGKELAGRAILNFRGGITGLELRLRVAVSTILKEKVQLPGRSSTSQASKGLFQDFNRLFRCGSGVYVPTVAAPLV